MKTYLKFLIIMFLMITSPITTNAISLNPGVTIKTNGESINVNKEHYLYLTSSEIQNLFSLTFEMKYDPNMIEIISITPSEIFDEDNFKYNSHFNLINNNCKTLTYYQTFTGNSEGKTLNSQTSLVKVAFKLLKECKIPLQIINTNNSLFVGTPNIRVIMVDNNLNKYSFSSETSYIESSNFSSDDDIKKFISDVYTKTFSREPDESGFNYWYNKLISHEYSVRDFLINLLNEDEFIKKNLSNQEFITSMYSIIANREPDENGFNYWLSKLKEFQTRMDVKSSKSQIILFICNEAELNQRATKMNLKF